MKYSLAHQIELARLELLAVRPRSIRYTELRLRLRDLILKELKQEIRQDRAA
jgi:hypothetical protein